MDVDAQGNSSMEWKTTPKSTEPPSVSQKVASPMAVDTTPKRVCSGLVTDSSQTTNSPISSGRELNIDQVVHVILQLMDLEDCTTFLDEHTGKSLLVLGSNIDVPISNNGNSCFLCSKISWVIAFLSFKHTLTTDPNLKTFLYADLNGFKHLIDSLLWTSLSGGEDDIANVSRRLKSWHFHPMFVSPLEKLSCMVIALLADIYERMDRERVAHAKVKGRWSLNLRFI